MKYYEMHENCYQDLRDQGYISWDRLRKPEELLEQDINLELEKRLKYFFPKRKGKKALDLGCGTGTVSFFLSKYGFDTLGFDVSKTAIEMAKENAKALNLPAKFLVQDLNWWEEQRQFDLVVDSSLLHCIVKESERDKFFKFTQNSLSDNGLLFIHTMIQSEDMSDMLSADHLILRDEVLWSTGPVQWEMDWETIEGKRVFPHRMIKKLETFNEEIERHGFEFVESKLILQEKLNSMLVGWLRKKLKVVTDDNRCS